MEVADVELSHAALGKVLDDSLLHAAGRAVRERETEHVGERDARFKGAANALRQNLGFSAARRGEHQVASALKADRLFLMSVEDDLSLLALGVRAHGFKRLKVGVGGGRIPAGEKPAGDVVAVAKTGLRVLLRADFVVPLVGDGGEEVVHLKVRGLVAVALQERKARRGFAGDDDREVVAAHEGAEALVVVRHAKDRFEDAFGELPHPLDALAVVSVADQVFAVFSEGGELRVVGGERLEVHGDVLSLHGGGELVGPSQRVEDILSGGDGRSLRAGGKDHWGERREGTSELRRRRAGEPPFGFALNFPVRERGRGPACRGGVGGELEG